MVRKMEQAVHSCTTIWEDPGRYIPISIPDYKPKWWYSKLESNLKDTIKCWMESSGNRARQWGFWKLEMPRERHFWHYHWCTLNASHSLPLFCLPWQLGAYSKPHLSCWVHLEVTSVAHSDHDHGSGREPGCKRSILMVRRPFPQPIHHSLPLYSAWYHMTCLRTGIFCPHSTCLWQPVKDSHFGLLLGPLCHLNLGNSCVPLFTSMNSIPVQPVFFSDASHSSLLTSKPLALPLFGTLLTPSPVWDRLILWAGSHHQRAENLQASLQFNTLLNYIPGSILRSLGFGVSLVLDIQLLKND